MKEPKEKRCIHCGGKLRKHGFLRYTRKSGETVEIQQYECGAVGCRKRSTHWKGEVVPRKVY